MAKKQADHLLFSLPEVAEMIMKAQGITEGHWTLSVEFGLGAGLMRGQRDKDEPPQLTPAAIVPVFRVGVRKGPANEISVDASKLKESPNKARPRIVPKKRPGAIRVKPKK